MKTIFLSLVIFSFEFAIFATELDSAEKKYAVECEEKNENSATGENFSEENVFLNPSKPAVYFVDEGFNTFRETELRSDDVLLVSYPKCGTSWSHQILFSLLRMDENGDFPDKLEQMIGGIGQVYPDSVYSKNSKQKAQSPSIHKESIEDLLAQESPRLFSSHIRPNMLPASLKERGKLIIVARNPKDGAVSYFHFRKKMHAFCPEEIIQGDDDYNLNLCLKFIMNKDPLSDPRGYGDYFSYYEQAIKLQEQLEGRATFLFYESLKLDFDHEVNRIAEFLGIKLTAAKLDKLKKHTSFKSMSDASKAHSSLTARKGVVGDFQSHDLQDKWEQMDAIFAEKLAKYEAFSPIYQIMNFR